MIKTARQTNAKYAEFLAIHKNKYTDPKEKKMRGQFFTAAPVAELMASMMVIKPKMKILDPGGGTGVLIAAIVDRIISEKINVKISVDLYENDVNTIPYLKKCMRFCKKSLQNNGIENFDYNIICEDFVKYNRYLFDSNNLKSNKNANKYANKYDTVICNPPYFKIKKEHEYSTILHEYIYGQPNVYYLFMLVSEKLTKYDGQVIFITPRSYCSGNYFERFRIKFFNLIEPSHFHLFNSRRDKIFNGENVWQESIILSGFKRNSKKSAFINISFSNDSKTKKDINNLKVNKELIMDFNKNNYSLIRFPASQKEIDILKIFDKWNNSLNNMKMNVSTGPIVSFRNKNFISDFSKGDSYPLFCMKHIKNFKVIFPINVVDKEKGISRKGFNEKRLTKSSNYVIIKRVTSKEQKKRIHCGAFLKDEYDFNMFGLDNHLNYIYKVDGSLTEVEVIGLTAILSSTIVDCYFRTISGNTQVNATDLKNLPLPSHEFIINIGKSLLEKKVDFYEIDKILTESYGINFI